MLGLRAESERGQDRVGSPSLVDDGSVGEDLLAIKSGHGA